MRTAIVIGATGLVGKQLVQLLLKDDRYTLVKIFVRRSAGVQHSKLKEYIIDFDRSESWQQEVAGDVLFSALGTTLKQAGSKEAQYKIDHTYQYQFAKAAAANGVNTYVLISAAGVSERSMIFYNRMKAELERDIRQLPFKSINIIRPGLLAGDRKEERMGEKISYAVLDLINKFGILKKYRPINDITVATAMIKAAEKNEAGIHTYELEEVFKLAR